MSRFSFWYAKCHYAKCRYPEYRNDECCGTREWSDQPYPVSMKVTPKFSIETPTIIFTSVP
jgi:hypothetical protein